MFNINLSGRFGGLTNLLILQKMKHLIISLLAVFILTTKAMAQNHWNPVVNQWDNYQTLTGYVVINGVEQESTDIEVAGFVDGVCRGSQRLIPSVYKDHNYLLYLQVWGSVADNGKSITLKVYDHATSEEFPAAYSPTYEYNGMIGYPEPYGVIVKVADQLVLESALAIIEGATYSFAQADGNTRDQIIALLVDYINQLLAGTEFTIMANNITISSFISAQGSSDGSFSFKVTLTKNTSSETSNIIYGGIIRTITGIDAVGDGKVAVFPNPATDELRIENGKLKIGDKVKIYDISGRVAEAPVSASVQGAVTVDVSQLPKGVYLLKIGNEKAKFVKK